MMLKTLPLSKPDASPEARRVVCYHEQGTRDPLVLIHGVGLRSLVWAPQISCFARTHRVIALNMPGHGGSTSLSSGADLRDFVQWLAEVLTALGLDTVNLAGHSMGALIAGGFVATYPEKVSRVALLNSVYRRTPAARKAVEERALQIVQRQMDVEEPLIRWFGDCEAEQGIRNKVKGWLETVDPNGYAVTYSAFAKGDDVFADQWGQVSCPALFLTGEDDPNSTGAMTREMASAAPNGKARVIKHHKHMVNLTAPDQVNAAMAEWLQEAVEPATIEAV